MNLYDVLKKPLVSEKAEMLRANNVYTFEVDNRANKKLIRDAVQTIFDVRPVKVNIAHIQSKKKRSRYTYGLTPRRKKAYIFLKPEDKIPLFEGV